MASVPVTLLFNDGERVLNAEFLEEGPDDLAIIDHENMMNMEVRPLPFSVSDLQPGEKFTLYTSEHLFWWSHQKSEETDTWVEVTVK